MRFQAGRAVQETAFYVSRAADRELDEALRTGVFCYVLATTQAGKSSLKVRAARSLEAEGVRCAMIDLTDVAGESTTVEQWYHGLAWSIARKAGLGEGFEEAWGEHAEIGPGHRWSVFVREYLVPRLDGKLVVFLDEINVVLSLAFSADAFFASLRELFDALAEDARLARITFCLLGIASAEALMKDPGRSPFRDSKGIVLDDFTREEMDALLPGLESAGEEAGALLDAVFTWTHGHPYMTQRLCAEIVRGEAEGSAHARVKPAVAAVFLDPERERDPNLRFAERYLARDAATTPTTEMLYLYRRLLDGEAPVSDPDSQIEQQLRLSGLSAARVGKDGKRRLEVRNRVFAEVFDRDWVKEREAGLLFGERLRLWLAAPETSKEQFVLRGSALVEALARVAGKTDVTGPEGAFLRASQVVLLRQQKQEASAQLEAERADRAEQGGRLARRNVRFLLSGSIVLMLALAVAGWQYTVARAAVQQEQAARRSQQGLRASLLAGQQGHELEGLLLGIEAVAGFGGDPAKSEAYAEEGMTRGLMSTRQLATLTGHIGPLGAVAVSPDGTRVVTGGADQESATSDSVTDSTDLDTTARIWDTRTGQQVANLVGHTWTVSAVAFSPDGTRILTGSGDKTARLWDARDGKPLETLKGHTDQVSSVAFSPDGTRVLTGSRDKTARLWDGRDGKPLRTLQGHTDRVSAVAFSPDGVYLLTGSWDTTARVWRVADGKLLASLEGHTKEVESVAFSPESARVLTGSLDKSARLWDASDGKLILTLEGHTGGVSSVEFSPSGKLALTASLDKTARLWETGDGKIVATLFGHTGAVSSARFSPDGSQVLTGSKDTTARLWDGNNGKLLATLQGHTEPVSAVAYSPDGTRVITGSQDKSARLWEARGGKPLATMRGHLGSAFSIAFSPDGSRIVTGSKDKTARIWDARDGTLVATTAEHGMTVTSIAFSPDGTRVLTGSLDNFARLWDARDGKLLITMKGHTKGVWVVAFSPDGSRILTGSGDFSARLWDAHDGKPLITLSDHTNGISAVAFSPDGTRILTGSLDMTARLWNASDGKSLGVLRRHKGRVSSVAFSRDGTRVLTGSDDNIARLWNGYDGTHLVDYLRHADRVSSVAFSPDGTRVLTGSDDKTARLWDTRSGRLLAELAGHMERISSLAFSPDGTRVATGSYDATARLWDANDGKLLAILPGHLGWIDGLAFSPDGRHLATASEDGTARIWSATSEGFLIQACQFLHPWPAYDQVKDTCAPYVDRTP